MRHTLKAMAAAIVGAVLLLPLSASAQELTLKLDPGVAIPFTEPQVSRFYPGGDLRVMPSLGIGPYVSVAPELDLMGLPSQISGVAAGTVWGVGGELRVQRPHDYAHNSATGVDAFSPWADLEALYSRTGDLGRPSAAAAVGVAFPTSAARTLWTGPFFRLAYTFDGEREGFNTNDAKMMIFGVSFEFGGSQSQPVIQERTVEKTVFVEKDKPCPAPAVVQEKAPQLDYVVRFPFNSDVLKSSQQHILDEAVATITSQCGMGCSINIDGYASSEGQLAYNKTLSGERAHAASHYLATHLERGVLRQLSINVQGKGIDNPVGNNATPAGRAANRRAEVIIHIVKESK